MNRAAADLPDGDVTTPGRGAPAQRPSYVQGASFYPANRTPSSWVNLAASTVPARGTWGTLPRNAVRGPGLWQFDFSAGTGVGMKG